MAKVERWDQHIPRDPGSFARCPFCNVQPYVTANMYSSRIWLSARHRAACYLSDHTVIFCAESAEEFQLKLKRWNHQTARKRDPVKIRPREK